MDVQGTNQSEPQDLVLLTTHLTSVKAQKSSCPGYQTSSVSISSSFSASNVAISFKNPATFKSPSTSVPERAPASYKATDTAQGKNSVTGLAISVIGQKYGYVPSSGYENQQSCCVDRFHLRLGRVKSLLPSSFQQYSFKPYPSQEMQMMEMELEKIQESAMEQLSMGKVMSYKDQPSSLLAFQEMIKQSQSHHHPTFYFLLCQQHRIQQLEANLSVSLEERIVLGRLASFLLLPSSKILSFLLSLGTSSATYFSVIF